MIFTPTPLPGVTLIEPELRKDSRGWFARVYCEREFEARGLPTRMVQTNASFTRGKGTVRGMHCQRGEHAEDKLVRCTGGAIWDAVVDLRPESPTYCRWYGAELSAANGRMLLVPRGFAHGFVTLTDEAAVSYQVSNFYAPGAEGGVRWNDPAFGIDWPAEVLDLSDKDRHWPDYVRQAK